MDFQKLAEKWPSAVVSRSQIEAFTGGIINARTAANLDCLGRGPAGRFRIGRKVGYPVAAVIEWLESRSQELA